MSVTTTAAVPTEAHGNFFGPLMRTHLEVGKMLLIQSLMDSNKPTPAVAEIKPAAVHAAPPAVEKPVVAQQVANKTVVKPRSMGMGMGGPGGMNGPSSSGNG